MKDSAQSLYSLPLLELLYRAQTVHREHHDPTKIQKCTLLSIKTGGCPEDCSYCPQSAHYKSQVNKHGLLAIEEVKTAARKAKLGGAERFCMGAAWRSAKDGPEFDQVIEMIKSVKEEGLEACVTLGMLSESQAMRLKAAGLDAYNHNIDTSEEYYAKIITTRTFDDRLQTLKSVRKAGIGMCCGGIVGMGESINDRCEMLNVLAGMDPPPESVPINLLIPVAGTPLGTTPPLDPIELVRTIAVARLLMPESKVPLSAGRTGLTQEAQILCFFAGANSVFIGDKLLTRSNPSLDEDYQLMSILAGTPNAVAAVT